MKKNKKVSRKMSVVATHVVYFAGVGVMLFVMVILNWIASSNCRQLERDCIKKEEKLKTLDDSLQRETARWEEMKTAERLEVALRNHGLSMHYPNASQTIRMRDDGEPVPGQLSLAKAEQREKGLATANYSNNNKNNASRRRTKRRR